jgi:hypothetical protein
VGLAATFLGLVQRWRGHRQVTVDDITLVLLFCGVICGSSLLLFRRLRGGAGAGLYKASRRT